MSSELIRRLPDLSMGFWSLGSFWIVTAHTTPAQAFCRTFIHRAGLDGDGDGRFSLPYEQTTKFIEGARRAGLRFAENKIEIRLTDI